MIKKTATSKRRSKVVLPSLPSEPNRVAPKMISCRYSLLIRSLEEYHHEREMVEDVHQFPLASKTLKEAQVESEQILFTYTECLREYYSMAGVNVKSLMQDADQPPFEFEIVERM